MIPTACRRLRPALVDLAIGSLAPGDARAVEAHLAGCASCRADLAAMRGLPGPVGDPTLAAPPEDFWHRQRAAIMHRIRATTETSDTRGSRHRWRLAGALATAALAVFVVRTHVERKVPEGPPAIDRLDDDALFHLHDLLPALAPATAIDDADGDVLAINDLVDDDLDGLDDQPEP